jgi:hypothetical protein
MFMNGDSAEIKPITRWQVLAHPISGDAIRLPGVVSSVLGRDSVRYAAVGPNGQWDSFFEAGSSRLVLPHSKKMLLGLEVTTLAVAEQSPLRSGRSPLAAAALLLQKVMTDRGNIDYWNIHDQNQQAQELWAGMTALADSGKGRIDSLSRQNLNTVVAHLRNDSSCLMPDYTFPLTRHHAPR